MHRMGEGVGFTGIQPSGTHVDPIVVVSRPTGRWRPATTTSSSTLCHQRAETNYRRFHVALGKKAFDVDDVAALGTSLRPM